jgi:5S rRNA maturation endonuclease (ribonuclease M5)
MLLDKHYAIDIREWLEDRFEVKLAPPPNVKICCRFCTDTKFRLYIAVEDYGYKKKGWCWCQNEQKLYSFVELYSQTEDLSYSEAEERLFDKNPSPRYAKINEFISKLKNIGKNKTKEVLEVKPVVYPPYYQPLWQLSQTDWEKLVPAYMKQRKITQEMCDRYYLGYCTAGYRWGMRVIIPIYQNSMLVAYQGRAMQESNKPKYIFNTDAKIGNYLFNLDNIPAAHDSVIVVEGVFDVWGVVRAGFDNVVASFGKHLTDYATKLLINRFKRVYIMWDDDAYMDIVNLAEVLSGIIEVYVVDLPGKDPDSATSEAIQKAIAEAYPWSNRLKITAIKKRILMN